MRYSFHVVGDGSSYNDDGGMEFPTNETAFGATPLLRGDGVWREHWILGFDHQ